MLIFRFTYLLRCIASWQLQKNRRYWGNEYIVYIFVSCSRTFSFANFPTVLR